MVLGKPASTKPQTTHLGQQKYVLNEAGKKSFPILTGRRQKLSSFKLWLNK